MNTHDFFDDTNISYHGDSALIDLINVLIILRKISSSTDFENINQSIHVSEILSKNNPSLGENWKECYHLCQNIIEKVSVIVDDLIKSIEYYIQESLQLEQQAITAAEKYNENATSLLDDLDSIEL